MTVWFPWASQQGAIKYTTGPDPAGGCASGAPKVCPQIVGGGPKLPAAGCCARSGEAHARANSALNVLGNVRICRLSGRRARKSLLYRKLDVGSDRTVGILPREGAEHQVGESIQRPNIPPQSPATTVPPLIIR